MSNEATKSQKEIWELARQAELLERKRRQAYESRLNELITEYEQWDMTVKGNKERVINLLANEAFSLGKDFGCNKTYEYL